MKKICITIPCYNEEKNVQLIHEEIDKVISKIKNIKFTFLFIDDASEDQTWYKIKQIAKKNKNIKGHKFTTNQGKDIALFSSINEIKNFDALIFIRFTTSSQSNLKLIQEWQKGYKIVR